MLKTPNNKWIVMGVFLFIVLLVLFSSTTSVSAGHRGVVIRLGAVQELVLQEGFHFKLPFIDNIKEIDVRVQKSETDVAAASKDLQTITSKIAVNFHVSPNSAAKLFQNVGISYNETIIAPAVQEVVKSVTARYTAEDLISKRQNVGMEIRNLLIEKLSEYGVVVDQLNVVNFEFSPEFNKAIESKQTAEQLALKAKRDLERIKIEAEQAVTQAQAQAQALQLQKSAVTPELIRLREVEAQIKAIEKWNGILPNVTGGTVPFIQVGSSEKSQ